MAKQLQLKTLNREFDLVGITERLVKGNGYYYFIDGDAVKWKTSSINVNALNCLDVYGWLAAWKELSGENKFPNEK